MLVARTVDPPAGANPIPMISVHAGWATLFQPVVVGVARLVLVAVFRSGLFPGSERFRGRRAAVKSQECQLRGVRFRDRRETHAHAHQAHALAGAGEGLGEQRAKVA